MNKANKRAAPARACPICGKPLGGPDAATASGSGDRYRPFCSKRCADIDLNRWLKGGYAIPGAPDADEDGEAPPTPRKSDEE